MSRVLIVGAAPSADVGQVSRSAGEACAVVAADGGVQTCIAAGVTPDVVVGDLDSAKPSALEAARTCGARIIRHDTDKDASDLDLAIEVAREMGATEAVFTGFTGGRLDHTLAALGSMAAAQDLRPVLSETELAGWVLSKRGRRDVDLEGGGAHLSVFALTERARATSTGLRWALDGVVLPQLGSVGISNEIVETHARIEVRTGLLLVLVDLRPGRPG